MVFLNRLQKQYYIQEEINEAKNKCKSRNNEAE